LVSVQKLQQWLDFGWSQWINAHAKEKWNTTCHMAEHARANKTQARSRNRKLPPLSCKN
jgi:hypothetical protein